MSWSGFKKNVGRATTQVMMKTGHVEKTSDREYEVEERRYRTLESASLRLQKEAKGYLDSLRAMTASQMRIAETIDAFYGDSGATDGVSRSYKQAVEDLDAETVKALDGPYRCVTLDPELQKIAASIIADAEERGKVLQEIEAELNWKAGNRKNYTRDLTAKDKEEVSKLIESIYRTTVLEPISRFCAYFPDINECIKKRNHKMLDYDAMRSKVKKLTEKPDKDPSKLPRTEKETEMVNTTNPFRKAPSAGFSVPSTPNPRYGGISDKPKDKFYSPIKANEEATLRSVGLTRSPGSADLVGDSGLHMETPKASASPMGKEGPAQQVVPMPGTSSSWKYYSNPRKLNKGLHFSTPFKSFTDTLIKGLYLAPFPSMTDTAKRNLNSAFARSQLDTPKIKAAVAPTPFFNPSELEGVMAPLKKEYIERQADLLMQAKVAYDQLNEQLTNELPQLIDLRVPYLDPSFEALVKIQLRFCAEAYSRMAQVQQYLDASTRDQYASGDLDARVEDVLGQIRELSIAGTV